MSTSTNNIDTEPCNKKPRSIPKLSSNTKPGLSKLRQPSQSKLQTLHKKQSASKLPSPSTKPSATSPKPSPSTKPTATSPKPSTKQATRPINKSSSLPRKSVTQANKPTPQYNKAAPQSKTTSESNKPAPQSNKSTSQPNKSSSQPKKPATSALQKPTQKSACQTPKAKTSGGIPRRSSAGSKPNNSQQAGLPKAKSNHDSRSGSQGSRNPQRGKSTLEKPKVRRQNEITSNRNSGDGPVPPPRSAVAIKRSVTTRKTSAKSIDLGDGHSSRLTKHPSLVKQRSISSTSSTDSSVPRKLNTRALKTRQLSRTPEKPIARSTKQSTKRRQLSHSSRDKSKENLSHEKCVKYRETVSTLQKSRSKESVGKKEVEIMKRRSSVPAVSISPAQLLLNQTLHDRFSKSVRSGIVLSDSQASLLSFSSDPSLCISNDTEFMSLDGDEMVSDIASHISDDLFASTSVSDVAPSPEMLENSSELSDQCHKVLTDDSLDVRDHHEVTSNNHPETESDCSMNYTGPSGPNDDVSNHDPVQVQSFDPSAIEIDRATLPFDLLDSSSMNDLSPKTTSSYEFNIPNNSDTSPEKQHDEKSINLDSNSSTLTLTNTQELEIDIPSKSQLITEEKWNSSSNLTSYNSPEDNCLEQEKDSYYDSSERNIEHLKSTDVVIDKELNTDRNNMSQSLQNKDVNKTINFEAGFPTTNKEDDVPISEQEFPSFTSDSDVLCPLSPDADPLGLLDYDQQISRPLIFLDNDFDDQEISTAPPKCSHNSHFRRSQRSIRGPKKRNAQSKMLVRATSLEQRYLTKTLQSNSLNSLDVPEIFIVQDLHSPTPMSGNRQYLSSRTPEILITNDYHSEMLECLQIDQPKNIDDSNFLPNRRVVRRKDRTGVVRRFSETQVFKHHREKYQKQKEYEHKYNSCPISGETSPEKMSGNIRSIVKRVTSMLNPSVRPRVLVKKNRRNQHEFGSTNSVFIDFGSDSLSSRSLHDEMPDSPNNLLPSGSLKRCNSLELEDPQISSIRRTMSDREKQDSESPDHGLTSKAKSISAHLDRIRMNQQSEDFPPLPFQTWSDFITSKELDKKQQEQQHHIWELIMTEHSYLSTVMFVVTNLLSSFRQLQMEGFLTKFDLDSVFLNIEQIQDIHLTFWRECIEPIINDARDVGDPLSPEILTKAGTLFEEELNPYFTYFTKYTESQAYRKLHNSKNSDFKEFINWCDTQLRSKFDRLRLEDMLIKPIQRVLQYHLMIKDIYKSTVDDDCKTSLKIFHDKVKRFGDQLNSRKEEKEEQQKIEIIKDRIDGYNVLQSSGHTNEQINQVLCRYNKFDLAERVPYLNSQRKFLHEQPCKLVSVAENKSTEVLLFLFSDLLLITKPTKSSKRKSKITKQPFTLSRIVIEELKDVNNTSLIIYLNEYGSAIDMFLLQSSNSESHTTFLNAIKQAKDNHERELKRYYDETDSSNKSNSSISINSTTTSNNYLESPLSNRHQPCSITRSSSEHYPQNRRNIAEPSTSVSRAQSMPASNEKRNLIVEQNNCLATSSSASSSTSGSAASVSGTSDISGASHDSSNKSVTLSDIKETDKNLTLDGSDHATLVKAEAAKMIEHNDELIGNLSTEFQSKLDMKGKNIDETVITRNPPEFDLIYKIPGLEQS